MLGLGILKGLGVTLRNFLGSYRDPERLITVEYPEERLPLPEQSRAFPMLIYDGEDPIGGLRCVACKICEKECPSQCIYIVKDRDARGRPMKRPKIFDLDISTCMGCGICAEVCPFDSIKMDAAYERSAESRFERLLLRKEDLAKPNAYYHKIHPTEAAEADARLGIASPEPEAPPEGAPEKAA
ncbi:MAG: 4Fe-4S dicluster domain-containing protein [Verrucomicrobia bacterium]|nr:4Fe-4S dicluster domain-containing protein [Verrucomicrobiota bacterium]